MHIGKRKVYEVEVRQYFSVSSFTSHDKKHFNVSQINHAMGKRDSCSHEFTYLHATKHFTKLQYYDTITL
jgi:hypothetical protein